MSISQEDVSHMAHLAKLGVSKSELSEFANQLGIILSYMATLKKVDTKRVLPTFHPSSFENAFRNDCIKTSLPQELALENAPEKTGNFFSVPRVIQKVEVK